jgi:hypothetical protein
MTTVARTYLAYVQTSGLLDTRYALGINNTVWSLATVPDGKILIG